MYYQTCTGVCYNDFVLGDPSHYDTAYFEVASVRVYGQPGELTVLQSSRGRRSAELWGFGIVAVALGISSALIWTV